MLLDYEEVGEKGTFTSDAPVPVRLMDSVKSLYGDRLVAIIWEVEEV